MGATQLPSLSRPFFLLQLKLTPAPSKAQTLPAKERVTVSGEIERLLTLGLLLTLSPEEFEIAPTASSH
jgi:hypothetical protein